MADDNEIFLKISINGVLLDTSVGALRNEAAGFKFQSCVLCDQLRMDHPGYNQCLFDSAKFKARDDTDETYAITLCRAWATFAARNPYLTGSYDVFAPEDEHPKPWDDEYYYDD